MPTLEFTEDPDWLQERTTGREKSREVVVGPSQRAEDSPEKSSMTERKEEA